MMWIKKQFKTTMGKVGFLSEVVPLLRGIIWCIRLVLEIAGDKEEAEKLMQALPQFVTAPWFSIVFLAVGLFLIWWNNERSTHKKLSATEIERKQEMEKQLEGLNNAEMEVVRFLQIHGTAAPHQIIAHLRSKGFDEADRIFNNLRSRTTLIITVEGMSASMGINPAMKDLLEMIFLERQTRDENQQASDPAADRKSWLLASAVVVALIIVAAGGYTLITSRSASKAARKQEATTVPSPTSQSVTVQEPVQEKQMKTSAKAESKPAPASNEDTSVGPKVKVVLPFVADTFPPAPEGEELPRKYERITDGFGKHVTLKNNRIAGGVRVPPGGNPQDTKIINNETLGNTLENAGKMERTTVVGANNIIKNDVGGEMKDTTAVTVPQGATVNIAPNGFAISGGNVSNPTVNNFAPLTEPDRHIPQEKRSDVLSWLSQTHGTVTINAYQGGTKAYRFAEEWRDVFTESHWDMKYNGRIHEFSMGSHPFAGVVVRYHGVKPPEGTPATMPTSGIEMYVVKALSAVPAINNISLSPEPSQPEGSIEILIGPVNMPNN